MVPADVLRIRFSWRVVGKVSHGPTQALFHEDAMYTTIHEAFFVAKILRALCDPSCLRVFVVASNVQSYQHTPGAVPTYLSSFTWVSMKSATSAREIRGVTTNPPTSGP
jgi:hypothetical protein